MWNKPTNKDLDKLPLPYATESIPLREKVIHMHFFIGGSDWYATEYDPENQTFFGFAILNNDLEMAEWGYFSLNELASVKVAFLEIDRDLYFEPTQAQNIQAICKAQGWRNPSEKEAINSTN